MAKARAIVKRRKAVRNIKKITKTMQMIATAKFQKSLKRAVGTKPYTLKVRELVREVAGAVSGQVDHPLLRQPGDEDRTNRVVLVVLTADRGLAGAYNGSVLRTAIHFYQAQREAGKTVDVYMSGKKGVAFVNFRKIQVTQKIEAFGDNPKFVDIQRLADHLMQRFLKKEVDSVHVAYMNFISAGSQKPEVTTLLPLSGIADAAAAPKPQTPTPTLKGETIYDFYPEPRQLLDELLPLTVRTALFQSFLDSITSEHVSRMVAMKSATDNADKMQKALTMQYNRARQSQITTELSEIMGGVEAMKG